MGFLERAIKRGIGNAVTKAVEPKTAEPANKSAADIDQAAATQAQGTQTASII